MRKIIIATLVSLSLNSYVCAESSIGDKTIKYGAILAGAGIASIAVSNMKNKKISTPVILGDVNKNADNILDDVSLLDKAMIDFSTRKKLLSEINDLLKSDKLTVTNRDSLNTLKNRLEDKDRYLEKPNPYLKGNSVVENKRELPISEIENPYLIETPYGDLIDTSTDFPINPPRNYDEYLTLKQNSTIMAHNLGGPRKGYAAHHIIPALDKYAQAARDILKKHGIDINDALNGVFLPTNNQVGGGLVHRGRHPKEYSDKVSELIVMADNNGGAIKVESVLKEMKSELQKAQPGIGWRDVFDKIKV